MIDSQETLFAASLQVPSVRRFVPPDWEYAVEMYVLFLLAPLYSFGFSSPVVAVELTTTTPPRLNKTRSHDCMQTNCLPIIAALRAAAA